MENKSITSRKTYNINGILKKREYLNNNSELHRDGDKPAYTYYYENGIIGSKIWYKNNEIHRDNKPALIEYDIKGNIIKENYYLDGKLVEKQINNLIDNFSNEDILKCLEILKIMKK
jgi:antitoxin component YwqK of YwqJK toxin-antitoxin module